MPLRVCLRLTVYLGGSVPCALGRIDYDHDGHPLLLYCHRGAQADWYPYELAKTHESRHQIVHRIYLTFHGIDFYRSTRQRGEYPEDGRIPTLCQISDDQQCLESFVCRSKQVPGAGRLLLSDRSEVGQNTYPLKLERRLI